MDGSCLTGDFEGKVSYQGTCRRRLWRRASPSVGAPLGNLGGEGSVYWELREIIGGLWKWSICLCRSSVRGTWGGFFTGDPEGYVEEGSGDGHLAL